MFDSTKKLEDDDVMLQTKVDNEVYNPFQTISFAFSIVSATTISDPPITFMPTMHGHPIPSSRSSTSTTTIFTTLFTTTTIAGPDPTDTTSPHKGPSIVPHPAQKTHPPSHSAPTLSDNISFKPEKTSSPTTFLFSTASGFGVVPTPTPFPSTIKTSSISPPQQIQSTNIPGTSLPTMTPPNTNIAHTTKKLQSILIEKSFGHIHSVTATSSTLTVSPVRSGLHPVSSSSHDNLSPSPKTITSSPGTTTSRDSFQASPANNSPTTSAKPSISTPTLHPTIKNNEAIEGIAISTPTSHSTIKNNEGIQGIAVSDITLSGLAKSTTSHISHSTHAVIIPTTDPSNIPVTSSSALIGSVPSTNNAVSVSTKASDPASQGNASTDRTALIPTTEGVTSILTSHGIASTSLPLNTTHTIETSTGFFHKPGVVAGTFIAIGSVVIAGIILLVWRLRTRSKYSRLLHGPMDEDEGARLTVTPFQVQRDHISENSTIETSDYSGYRSTSPESYLPDMEELMDRPFLSHRSNSPGHRPNVSSAAPETAVSSLFTLQTNSNEEGSPVDPVDPYSIRYARSPRSPRSMEYSILDPSQTLRESLGSNVRYSHSQTVVRSGGLDDTSDEREYQYPIRSTVMADDADVSDSDAHQPAAITREVGPAFPRVISASMSWLSFS